MKGQGPLLRCSKVTPEFDAHAAVKLGIFLLAVLLGENLLKS